jgi:hypothetical protein
MIQESLLELREFFFGKNQRGATNLALLRHAALHILKREPSKLPIKRKRLKAAPRIE